jgi:hypothetical protein
MGQSFPKNGGTGLTQSGLVISAERITRMKRLVTSIISVTVSFYSFHEL